jgi:hypothetical protein
MGEQGYDFEETLEKLAAEEKLIEKCGLKLRRMPMAWPIRRKKTRTATPRNRKTDRRAMYDGLLPRLTNSAIGQPHETHGINRPPARYIES